MRLLLNHLFASALALTAIGGGASIASAQPVASVNTAAQSDALLSRIATTLQARKSAAAQRAALAPQYEAQLRTIDQLKRQRASWRRDRQLQDQLAASLETATQLAQLGTSVAALDHQLAVDRASAAAAIDAELAASPTAARRAVLAQAQATLQATPTAGKRILIPDGTLDPLADPEELDQQAQSLHAAENALVAQVALLDTQTTNLQRAAQLRREHERAGDLAMRDDDEPRHGAAESHASSTPTAQLNPTSGQTFPGTPGGSTTTGSDSVSGPPNGSFNSAAVASALSEVIDVGTASALLDAGRSNDPASKAAAAAKARAAVAARLQVMRAQRAAIEARAQSLRHR